MADSRLRWWMPAPALGLIASRVSAQGIRNLPLAGRARGVPWASTPLGVAAQLVAASALVFLVIGASRWLRPAPFRRAGRRSFLEDPGAVFPDAIGPGAATIRDDLPPDQARGCQP